MPDDPNVGGEALPKCKSKFKVSLSFCSLKAPDPTPCFNNVEEEEPRLGHWA